MAHVRFEDVSVDFPIYNAHARSLKNRVIRTATGGQLGAADDGRVIVRALDGLTFEINHGDRVGLIGHNGAGKSTLLRLLSKAYWPSHGTADIQGEVGSLIDINLGADPEATGRENIRLRASLLGMRRRDIDQKINEIIEFTELGDFVDMPLRTYSTGMQLRLAFAVATTIRPDILLMDEWLSVGDENFQHKAEQRMAELTNSTSIIVMATHSRDLLLKTCNRAIWLEHGKIKAIDDVKSLSDAYFGS